MTWAYRDKIFSFVFTENPRKQMNVGSGSLLIQNIQTPFDTISQGV